MQLDSTIQKKITMERNKGCQFPNCDRKHNAKGYCVGHYWQLKRGDILTPLGSTVGKSNIKHIGCLFPNCSNVHYCKGYCRGHYRQYKLGKPLTELGQPKFYPKDWELTCKTLREILWCDPCEGIPYWRKDPTFSSLLWKPAGRISSQGYRKVQLRDKIYSWHRLMFLYFYGFMPAKNEVVDHLNGQRSDNRLENLRIVTPEINLTNKVHATGIAIDPRGQYWVRCEDHAEARKILSERPDPVIK